MTGADDEDVIYVALHTGSPPPPPETDVKPTGYTRAPGGPVTVMFAGLWSALDDEDDEPDTQGEEEA